MGDSLTINQAVALLAKRKNMTQEELAKRAGISRISVNRFFRGHTQIRADDLTNILAYLDIDLKKLITEKFISSAESELSKVL